MTFSRTFLNPISTFSVTVTPNVALHTSGYVDALKEIENAWLYVLIKAADAGKISGVVAKAFSDLYKAATLLTMQVGSFYTPSSNQQTVRTYLNALRASIGVSAYSWTYHGTLNQHSKSLIDELRAVIGTTTGELAVNTTAGTDEGAVVKVSGTPDTYEWAATVDEAQGSPSIISGRDVRRIIRFPESTRKAGVESWLIFAHGGGGGHTGNNSLMVSLGDYDSGSAENTWESITDELFDWISTSGTVKYEMQKLTGYPTSGSGYVYLLCHLAAGDADDQANIYPVDFMDRGIYFPEVRLWQPGIS